MPYPNSVIKVIQAFGRPDSFLAPGQAKPTTAFHVEIPNVHVLGALTVHAMMIVCGFRTISFNDKQTVENQTMLHIPEPENLNFANIQEECFNDARQIWAWKYRHAQSAQTFCIKCIPFNHQMVILAGTEETTKIYTYTINIKDAFNAEGVPCDISKANLHSLFALVPKHRDLFTSYHKEIVKKLMPEITDIVQDEPDTTGGTRRVQRQQREPPPEEPFFDRRPPLREPVNPYGIGDRDLDPFGSIRPPTAGGGMYVGPDHPMFSQPSPLQPLRPPGAPDVLPPGAVPPGARFDPISPFGPIPGRPNLNNQRFRSGEPDPDEFQPPGYRDMFM